MSEEGKIVDLNNNKKEPLTPERLRKYKGLENITDEEAAHIIETIRRLAKLTFRYYGKWKQQNNQEEQQKAA